MLTRRIVAGLFSLMLLASLAVACAPARPEPDRVTVQLSWLHTVEFAGFYAAIDQGYYAEENLDVNLVAGAYDIQPWVEVAEGRADFGVAGGDSLLLARASGLPVRAIGVIFRLNPVVFMSLAESGITRPEDMVGKRVGIISPAMDNTNDIQLRAMLNRVGVDEASLELVLIEDYSYGSLTSGAMDVYSGFVQNEPVQAQMDGVAVNLIFPEEYGVRFYANVIFTRDDMITDHADVVERFIRATQRGHRYAVEHPDEVSALALQYDETLDLEFQRASMRAEIPLIDTGNAPLCWMDDDVWQITQDILLQQGLLTSPVDLTTLYTNQFVEAAQQAGQ